MNVILSILSTVLGWFFKVKDMLKKNKKIRDDRKLAQYIRDQHGRRVAEEWKKRKKY